MGNTGRDWNDAATGQEKPSDGSVIKNPPANVAVGISVSESGRSHEEGNGYPLQYSCLGNSMARGAWPAAVQGVSKSWTLLRNMQRRKNSSLDTSEEKQSLTFSQHGQQKHPQITANVGFLLMYSSENLR